MKTTSIFTLLLLPFLVVKAAEGGTREGKAKDGRVFSLFNVVTFQNMPCQSTASLIGSATNRNGTCYSTTDCNSRGGRVQGTCAAGFGVCCTFIVDTETTVSENNTYIQNPDYPTATTDGTSRTYTINKSSATVCTLRLDFETFSLIGTGGSSMVNEGDCLDTLMITTSPAEVVPTICGLNTGQHMYVDMGANSGDSVSLSFTFASANTPGVPTDAGRTWDIKATQIDCSSDSAPPHGCLQYHTTLTGRIETFNYQATDDNHLNDQSYSVCIRPALGFCCVLYSVCADQVGTGVVSGGNPPATPGFSLDPTVATTSMVDDICSTTDYISIPASAATCNPTGSSTAAVNSRYCGPFFNPVAGVMANAPVCDCTGPFRVDIYTNGVADTGTGNSNSIQSKGVCLEYEQVPC